ncbi:MAG: polyprenyl synthetase family protein [Cellvibrionaceae bacterium]
MLSFHEAVADDFTAVNQLIINQVHSDVGLVEDIGHYLIEAGGKRLRPLLVLLVARALDYNGNQQHTLAAIIEFIHSATLLHDDVVDTSDMRRGRATANAKWGNAPSVLVGDFLYSRAFQMMVAIGNMEVMKILSDTTNIIAEGEVQQLINAGDPKLSEEGYFDVIHKKTAVLFEAACETAAVLSSSSSVHTESNDSDSLQAQLKAYGYHLGMAFQLIDDALDYTGSSEDLGKNVGDDLAEGKPTLPLIFAMQKGSTEESTLIANTIKHSSGKVDPSVLQQIVTIIQQTGAIDYTREKAVFHVEQAKSALKVLAESKYKQSLLDLADFSISRNH